MKPSPCLISRLTPLFRKSPVIVHSTISPVSHHAQRLEDGGWTLWFSKTERIPALPIQPTALSSLPTPNRRQNDKTVYNTGNDEKRTSHVPPPTIAWCDYLSMV
nr:hypothetical protein L203_04060 [Cryptococcus depauperatus CBS 7841]